MTKRNYEWSADRHARYKETMRRKRIERERAEQQHEHGVRVGDEHAMGHNRHVDPLLVKLARINNAVVGVEVARLRQPTASVEAGMAELRASVADLDAVLV